MKKFISYFAFFLGENKIFFLSEIDYKLLRYGLKTKYCIFFNPQESK